MDIRDEIVSLSAASVEVGPSESEHSAAMYTELSYVTAWGEVLPSPAESLRMFQALAGTVQEATPWQLLVPKRILAKISVDPITGCWEVDVYRHQGYARVKYQGRTQPAHRVVFQLTKGELPADLHLDHRCRNRPCCYPEHLAPKSSAANTRARYLDVRHSYQPYLGQPLMNGEN